MTITKRKGDGATVVRVGQSFNMGEVLHACRLVEAVEAGDVQLAKRILLDRMGTRVRRKLLAMRDRCRRELAEAAREIPYEPTGKEVV